MLDIIIVGGGPAGLSAAIAARQRNHSAIVISNDMSKSGLFKAPRVDNYPGLPGISGAQLLSELSSHAKDSGADLIIGKVSTILPSGNSFTVAYDTEILTAKSIILATGAAQTALFPGEEELLGRGVSYCTTCDGMLYRGKRVCVICLAPGAEDEADYLVSLDCDVIRITTQDVIINGDKKVISIIADGEEIACEGVFIIRQAIAPHLLLPGLETSDGYISINPSGETNITGVFAAGDCVGTPHQIAKAVGQGLVAALSASQHIKNQ